MTFIRSDVKAQAFLDFFENNGIGDEDFRTGILAQLSRLSHCSFSDKGFYLSVDKGSKPTNLLEVMLLTQLSAVYDEWFAATERLQWAKSLEEKDLCVNAVTKLIRAFVALSEPLTPSKRAKPSKSRRLALEMRTALRCQLLGRMNGSPRQFQLLSRRDTARRPR
jgi:hypothetical protein